MAAWAERFGFVQEDWSRLRVRTAWGMIRSHSWEGECANCMFSGVAEMCTWGDKLEVNIVFAEGFLHGTVSLVVEDVEGGICTVLLEVFVARFPGFGDIQGLPVFEKLGMYRVGVVVVEDEDILVSA